MASIGSGPGISSGPKIQVNAVRPVSTSSASAEARGADAASTASAPAVSGGSAPVVSTTALDAGSAPVDGDRVASIRKAIEDGNYPIIPTKISDAMIAAGMMLRV